MLMIAGTVRNAVQLQTLNSKWQQKVESGNVLSRDEVNERANWTQEDWMKQNFQDQLAQNQESSQLTEITNKINYGGTLTAEEEKILEQQNPQALQKYKEMKAEKKSYEKKLQNCKTKDDVQRLKLEKLSQYASALKKVVNDPCIPLSEKLAKAQETLAKTRNIQDAERKFMATAKYASLPTEAEEQRERAEETSKENEAQQAQIQEGIEEQQETVEELTESAQENAEADAELTEPAADAEPTDSAAGEQELSAKPDDLEPDREMKTTRKKANLTDDTSDYASEIEQIFQQVQMNVQLAGFDGSGTGTSASAGSSHVNLIV